MRKDTNTPFQNVHKWVSDLKALRVKNNPDFTDGGLLDLLKLNFALIKEESAECLEALVGMQLVAEKIDPKTKTNDLLENYEFVTSMAHVLKELSDVVIVCNHAFSQLGFDGDVVTNMVTYNNDQKLLLGHSFNADGKLIVNPEDKKMLKSAVELELNMHVIDELFEITK